jgi:hypothetical protein
VSQDVEPLLVGGYRTHTSVDTVLYDFGAVSITYRIPLQGAFSTLLALGDDLYDNALLLQDSRQRIAQLLEIIASAVVRPHTSDFVEDYAIFQVEAFTVPCQAEALCAQYAQEIAQLLRLERQTLSQQEVSDALSHRISFSPDDVTIIDWNAAFLLAPDAEDVQAVLEFANVELLEMRYLDEQLDNDLDQSYEALSRHNWGRFRLRGSPHADLRRIAQMQVDEESRYFYTIPGRGIAALIQGLTRILTSKPACEAWSKGLSGAQSLSLALPYSCWYALDNPTVPRPLV